MAENGIDQGGADSRVCAGMKPILPLAKAGFHGGNP